MNTLDLSKKDLPTIPTDCTAFIHQPDYFKAIIANHTKTHSLNSFIAFKKLMVLDLSHNNLGQFNGLFLLRCLLLRNNNITNLNDHLFQMTQNIQLLDLSENKISKCTRAFLVLQKIITLNMNNNLIADLDAFKIFKTNQLSQLQYLGLSNNTIEDKYQTKFESTLTYFFPQLDFVLTRFCQFKDRNAFKEILEPDYYIEEVKGEPAHSDGFECSFIQNDSEEIFHLIEPIPNIRSSAKKSHRSANSVDSRFSSFKKTDVEYIKRSIENRKKELQKLDQIISTDTAKRDTLQSLQKRYQGFLEECKNKAQVALKLKDPKSLERIMQSIGQFAGCIDNLSQQRQRGVVTELLKEIRGLDQVEDIDRSMALMEELVKKMSSLLGC